VKRIVLSFLMLAAILFFEGRVFMDGRVVANAKIEIKGPDGFHKVVIGEKKPQAGPTPASANPAAGANYGRLRNPVPA
jgi:hypothetical protein